MIRRFPRPGLRSLRVRIAAVLAGSILVSGGCGDATGPLPRDGVPQALEFSMGGYGTTSVRVKLQGDVLLVTRTPWVSGEPFVIDSMHVQPDAEAWTNFWAAADEAGVRRWSERYRAEHIEDGMGWSLRLKAPGVHIESNGSNAYPDRRGREHEGAPPADFRAFMDAVSELIDAPL